MCPVLLSLPPHNKWNHIDGFENTADCASRIMFTFRASFSWFVVEGPTVVVTFYIWMAKCSNSSFHWYSWWMCSHLSPVFCAFVPFNRYSSFTRLIWVTAWIMRFAYLFLARFDRSSQTQWIHQMRLSLFVNYWFVNSWFVYTLNTKTPNHRIPGSLNHKPLN